MRKRYFAAFALAAVMILAGCGGQSTSSSTPVSSTAGSSTAATSSETTTPSSTSAEATSSKPSVTSSSSLTKLAKPVLTLNDAKTGLVWAAVEHASKYQVKVNTGAFADVTDLSYSFSTTAGSYVVAVKAIGDATTYADSAEASWVYETRQVAISKVTVAGLTVTWTANGSVAVGFNATGEIVDADWAAATGSSFTATQNGKVGIAASSTYNTEHGIYYAGDKVVKYVWVIADASADKVLLDEKSDVVDGITHQAYGNSGWEDAGAHSVLAIGKADIEETDKVVDFKIQQLSNAYKYGVTVAGLDGYSGINTTVRGDGKSTLVFQIEGAWGYASYAVGVLNANWHAIQVPFSDQGWKVNNTSQTLDDYAIAQGFVSAGYALYTVTAVSVVWKTVADAGYAFTHVYMKNVVLTSNWKLTAADEQTVSLGSLYTGKSANVTFKLAKTDTGYTLSTLNLFENLTAPLTATIEGAKLTLATADKGATLTYVGTVDNKGRTISFVSATGTYASYLQQISFNYVYMVDDFESYSATGTGFDGNNSDLSKVSGLRAAYYGEYYTGSGSGTSALGDKNWQKMGSTDYLNLITTEGHGGKQSAAFKRSTNSMRFITSAMAMGTAVPFPAADTLSFWVKGMTADVTLKVQPFDSTSGLYWSSMTTLTIPANSGWAQYTVSLSASKVYYGFGFLFSGASPVVYPEMDDIQLYTGANPWAVYVDASPIASGVVMTGATSTLKSVTATYAHDSSITVVAVDAAGTSHNLTGTYAVDAKNVITIDCGADLNYVGVLSADKTAIKYTSATGTLATYVAGLVLEMTVTGKTRMSGFENLTSSAAQTLFVAEETDSFTVVTDKTTYLTIDETVKDSGFVSLAMKADVTAGNYNGKYRYRFAQVASFGTVSNFAIRLKNPGANAITGGLFVVNTSNDSTKRTNSGVTFTIAAGADWTTFTGSMSSAIAVYGFSIYFNSVGTSLPAAAATLYLDNVMAW